MNCLALFSSLIPLSRKRSNVITACKFFPSGGSSSRFMTSWESLVKMRSNLERLLYFRDWFNRMCYWKKTSLTVSRKYLLPTTCPIIDISLFFIHLKIKIIANEHLSFILIITTWFHEITKQIIFFFLLLWLWVYRLS